MERHRRSLLMTWSWFCENGIPLIENRRKKRFLRTRILAPRPSGRLRRSSLDKSLDAFDRSEIPSQCRSLQAEDDSSEVKSEPLGRERARFEKKVVLWVPRAEARARKLIYSLNREKP